MQQNHQSLPLSLTHDQYKRRGEKLQDYRIGQYTIIQELGKGSFGKVFKATNQRGHMFAIKMLDKKAVRLQQNRRIKQIKERLILSEPKLMQQCDSINLLKCFEIFENEDLKILVIEYCDGLTLAEELKRFKQRNLNKPFSQKQAVDILRHIINGIAELHKHKIVHRDLKTDNIMKHEGIYKIIDFGFSKKLQLTHQSQATKNTILGTPTTMAPEVMLHKNYGLKADIWSIGVIFFEIVFGYPPYDSSNAKRFYEQIEKRFAQKEPSPYKGVTLSKEAHDFLEKVLKIDPDKRIGWREMIQHPLIKIKKEERLTDPFQERHPMVNPVVDKQLEVGSLIQAQLQIQEQQIKEKKNQPELSTQAKIANQNPSQKDNQRGLSKDNKMKKNQIDIQKLIEQQRQEARLKKKRQRSNYKQQNSTSKQIQLKNISQKTSSQDSSTNLRLTQRQELSSIYASRIKYPSQFLQCRSIHLQCLKSELILRDIIEPLQSRNMIDFEKRQSIELMHLLVSRCFKNLSLIFDKVKNNPEKLHRSFFNLKAQIQSIYKIVVIKFNDYDNKLLEIQNKYTQIAKDFFLKIFSSAQKYKNTIIGGVELKEDSVSQFYDFKKSEQIQYTCIYIKKLMPQIRDIGRFSERVKKHLKKYDMIMAISLETLGQQSFEKFVAKLLDL